MPKAFISYARDGGHGENLAIEIQQQLQAAGFAVFRDVTELKPGDTWPHKLEFELETSDVMVLVLSEKVRKSKWVHNEFSMAEEIGIPVIPVLAEVIRQPLWMRHLQILDFCRVKNWRELLDAINLRQKTSSSSGVASRQIIGSANKSKPAITSPSSSEERRLSATDTIVGSYIIHNDGTASDIKTKLMWKRCSEGQSGTHCGLGDVRTYQWKEAVAKFSKGIKYAGYNDWRIPAFDELQSLVDKSSSLKINQSVFPNTPPTWYWSFSSSDASNSDPISFLYGRGRSSWGWRDTYDEDHVNYAHVRLVRFGQ